MAEVAKTKGLNYNNSSDGFDNSEYKKNSGKKVKKAGADYQRSTVSYSSSSISANANLLAGRNQQSKPKKEEVKTPESGNSNEE
ncbi:MAG: hypothetical protein IKP88_13315 [Lachnospiraceae bacterium]|nr:hypothetical protein [Lachnospiraceae bacterium]